MARPWLRWSRPSSPTVRDYDRLLNNLSRTLGMPYPANVATARDVEADVRAKGATPATIALLNGQVHDEHPAAYRSRITQTQIRIGLDDDKLEYLGSGSEPVFKCSRLVSTHTLSQATSDAHRRDLGRIIASRANGGTTVAATMYVTAPPKNLNFINWCIFGELGFSGLVLFVRVSHCAVR